MANFFRPFKKAFIARSSERDRETDAALIGNIFAAINKGIDKLETERAGLQARVDDLLSCAAIVTGNDISDYVTRTDQRSTMLRDSENQIKAAQKRLTTLNENIAHLASFRITLKSRFPTF